MPNFRGELEIGESIDEGRGFGEALVEGIAEVVGGVGGDDEDRGTKPSEKDRQDRAAGGLADAALSPDEHPLEGVLVHDWVPTTPIGRRAPATPVRGLVARIEAPIPRNWKNPQIGNSPDFSRWSHDPVHHPPIGVACALPWIRVVGLSAASIPFKLTKNLTSC
ncbi:hypothetical protein CRG98_022664 [Punica granatum]|uniref:Uncharacterized protein n=1 Tax=Punica granatum TaxID=22663 RepID=A0A2I0JKX7_PUNGR|nr:hypothetical protein CRG98_022664 [Punica granatum]